MKKGGNISGDIITTAIKILIAGVLGGIIGYEGDVHERDAGLRTHILVSIGSALFTIISI